MARPPLKQQIDALVEKYGAEIAAAFREGVDEIKSKIVLRAVIDRLSVGDIDGAIMAMHLDAAAFSRLETAIMMAYQAGGAVSANNFPSLVGTSGERIVVRFDIRNPQADVWLRDRSSQLVTGIIDGQRVAIQTALQDGLSSGQNPTATALRVIGRINRVTGKREGGIIGLSDPQARYVASARKELLSGDPALLRNYMTRTLRDKRFDSTVTRAIRDGAPIPKDLVDQIMGRYSDRLLKLRGDMISRTETLTSINASAHEGFRQGLAKTNYSESDVIRGWDSAGDNRVRHTHEVLDGQEVRGLDIPFISPSGAKMLFPGDTSLGARVAEIVGCRCRLRYRIDPFGGRA